jgi:predicted polyphosphate/ATP-dependent NAD kinase
MVITLIGVMSLQSQIFLGPFNSSIPFPFSTSQEKKAMEFDQTLSVEIALIAGKAVVVKKLVVDYEKSLHKISDALRKNITNTKGILKQCVDYIDSKSSIASFLPGLSKSRRKMKLINDFKKIKIYKLKIELNKILSVDNYMTEGERKILLLDIIDRALKITI